MCKASLNILKSDLAESTLLSNLELLKPHYSDFPADLVCRITKDLYKYKLAKVRDLPKDEEMLQALTDLVLGLDMWSDDVTNYHLMEGKFPAFAPVLPFLKRESEEQSQETDMMSAADMFGIIDADDAVDTLDGESDKNKRKGKKTATKPAVQAIVVVSQKS